MTWYKRFALVMFACSVLSISGSRALAGDGASPTNDRPAQQTVQEIKKDFREAGKEVKEASRGVKASVKKAYRQTRDAVKEFFRRP
jgi:hypothetical protein